MTRKIRKYGIITSEIIQDSELSVTSKALYSLLCTFADKERKCYPSINRLAELLRVNRRTIERSVKELKEKGYIRKEGKMFTIY